MEPGEDGAGRDRFAVLMKKREGSEEVDQGGEEDVGVALPDDGEGTAEAHEEAEREEGQGETNEGEEEGVGEGGDGDGICGAIGEGVVMPDLKCGSLDAETAEGVELEADIDFFDVVGEGAGDVTFGFLEPGFVDEVAATDEGGDVEEGGLRVSWGVGGEEGGEGGGGWEGVDDFPGFGEVVRGDGEGVVVEVGDPIGCGLVVEAIAGATGADAGG